ncbi:SinI family restriction endonuclease [Candidatus Synechococcus calcipolaris G9]|uniref:SinI family restriction endonuclease n=1 Tax=Candidatus Synechococcus calcipolaris G9 TaxID=1497997 RepID=A0ABT6F1M2_9SYNE|nr:SinI family restriction endonuclease [Candidatus Synechococcus calcipolaris]MDG2991681.1 SinI family restriction endonuclease [Candidatus Synechococcus calcipolaris G9]
MPVNFDTIISTSSSEENFLQIFQDEIAQQAQLFLEAHRTILTACYRNPGLSPALKAHAPEMLAKAWLKRYSDSYENRISKRISQPPGTVADPIVSTIINARLTGLTAEHLGQIKYAHRLSMSAENIQGLLLEEFLAEQLADYGWYCCWGESIRHVDFCNIDGSLLQIKNRSNSENSSSSRVRINQPIEKWYRVDARTGFYRWSYFNEKYETDRFSEENFVVFVRQVLLNNPNALAVETNNPWQDLSDPSN